MASLIYFSYFIFIVAHASENSIKSEVNKRV